VGLREWLASGQLNHLGWLLAAELGLAVEAMGTHEELLAQGGRYAELFELQATGYR
jgi:hypothetical protein